MSAPIPPKSDKATSHRPRRSTWKLLLLTLAGIAALISSWLVSIHIHYRRQMEAVAVVERLDGSVSYHFSAPEWLQRLQPGSSMFGPQPLGPEWLREWLPAEIVVKHTLVIDGVDWLQHGGGMRLLINLSGVPDLEDSGPVSEDQADEDWSDDDPTDDDLKFVARFTRLERLEISDKCITDAGLEHLKSLRCLKTLDLSKTEITDTGLAFVAGFEKLEILRLDGTSITDAGLAKLVNLKYLKELDVRRTSVTKAGLKPFRGRTGLKMRQ